MKTNDKSEFASQKNVYGATGKALPFWERRGIAVIVLSAAVLFSLIFGTARSAKSLSEDLMNEFESSHAMSDVKVIFASADEISAVFRAVEGESGRWEEYVSVKSGAGDPGDPTGLSGELVSELKTLAAAMYNELAFGGKMTEAQSISAKKYYYDLLNAWTMLCENGDYRKAADNYNNAVNSFPLKLTGADSAAIFR